MTQKEQSVFAKALQSLLDDTGLFFRNEWADVFNIPQSKIEDWVNDKTMPSPGDLHMLIDCLESSVIQKKPLEEFEKLYNAKLYHISPVEIKTGIFESL